MSREKAKLTHGWRPAVQWQQPDKISPNLPPQPVCPNCATIVTDQDNLPMSRQQLLNSKSKLKCKNCEQPLWQATRIKNHAKPRIALAEYIKKKVHNFFDLFIGDEIHEYKEKDSGQGIAAGNIAQHCGRSLALTGTMMGGYSSTLFYLLYRFHPDFRSQYPFSGVTSWIKRYGFYQYETATRNSSASEHGRASIRRSTNNKPPKELPGLMPDALFHLIGHTIFLRLSDVARNLPDYTELILTTPPDDFPDSTGFSQQSAYNKLQEALKAALRANSKGFNSRMAATYLQSLLSFPDGCTQGISVYDPETGEEIVSIPPLEDRIYPKEQHLIDLINREKQEGRRCIVYASYTDTKDITGRLQNMLQAPRHTHRSPQVRQPQGL